MAGSGAFGGGGEDKEGCSWLGFNFSEKITADD